MTKNKNKFKKTIRNITPIVVAITIPIIIYTIIHVSVRIYECPYSTESKKELKPAYKATMKGISGFRLSSIWIMEEENYVEFFIKLKKHTGSNSFTEKELYSINLATEQLRQYMNSNSEDYPYNQYSLKFQIGKTPIYIKCTVEKQGKEFAFVYLGDEAGHLITDFYMMKDVQMISTGGGSTIVFEDEKVNKLSELHKLEKIYFGLGLNEERVIEFAELMKDINPDCKVFFGDEEIG